MGNIRYCTQTIEIKRSSQITTLRSIQKLLDLYYYNKRNYMLINQLLKKFNDRGCSVVFFKIICANCVINSWSFVLPQAQRSHLGSSICYFGGEKKMQMKTLILMRIGVYLKTQCVFVIPKYEFTNLLRVIKNLKSIRYLFLDVFNSQLSVDIAQIEFFVFELIILVIVKNVLNTKLNSSNDWILSRVNIKKNRGKQKT